MSRERDYRAQAARVKALAETLGGFMSRKSLFQAADCWLLLADLEAAGGPTPTRWDHSPPSTPRGGYGGAPDPGRPLAVNGRRTLS